MPWFPGLQIASQDPLQLLNLTEEMTPQRILELLRNSRYGRSQQTESDRR